MGSYYALSSTCQLHFSCGDLTLWEGDAIVSAANEALAGGGGVDGAIHRAAGPALLEACQALPDLGYGVRCPTGQARITPAGGRLRCDYVIHAVGPIYSTAARSAPLLVSAYTSSLILACDRLEPLKRIAFPAISCGVYGYPLEEAASLAIRTVRAHFSTLQRIEFVLFDERTLAVWEGVAAGLMGEPAGKT